MRFRRGGCPSVGLVILALLCAGSGFAAPLGFSFSGTFTDDTDVQLFYFYLPTPGTLTAETWSFGGGTDENGNEVPAGGFFPFLAIFDSTGELTPYESMQVGCVNCNPDPVTGYSYDAYIQTDPLPAGYYVLSLTEYDNVPLGPNLSDGFSQTDPYFTEAFRNYQNSCLPLVYGSTCADPQHAPFLLYESGEKRHGDWEVIIIGPPWVEETPEPASLALAIAGLALFLMPRAFGVRRIR